MPISETDPRWWDDYNGQLEFGDLYAAIGGRYEVWDPNGPIWQMEPGRYLWHNEDDWTSFEIFRAPIDTDDPDFDDRWILEEQVSIDEMSERVGWEG
jgi:hypothetical protein